MSQEVLDNLQELAESIEENTPRVEQQIASSGAVPDTAIVISASKYHSALERLAQEQLAVKFSRAYIEYIHDEVVLQRMPGTEPISPGEYRDPALIESAVARPFQTAFEQEIYPTIHAKAAALFHSLNCNHCFLNGNKRTALVALDMFMTANGYVLALSNDDAYELAKRTARHNVDGRSVEETLQHITAMLKRYSVEMQLLIHDAVVRDMPRMQEVYRSSMQERDLIINHPLNAEQLE